MTPAGIGRILPGDSKTAVISNFNRTNFLDLLANQVQGARESLNSGFAGPAFLAQFKKWHLFAEATSLNDGKPTQRHWRPYFTDQLFIATSRARPAHKCPPFLKLPDASNSGTRPNQRKACPFYLDIILEVETWRLVLIGKE
jgi:hypothetical protein